jgi:hypothetical protein
VLSRFLLVKKTGTTYGSEMSACRMPGARRDLLPGCPLVVDPVENEVVSRPVGSEWHSPAVYPHREESSRKMGHYQKMISRAHDVLAALRGQQERFTCHRGQSVAESCTLVERYSQREHPATIRSSRNPSSALWQHQCAICFSAVHLPRSPVGCTENRIL